MKLKQSTLLLALLVAPVTAIFRQPIDPRWVGVYLLFVNVYTFYVYYSDKRRAVNNAAFPAKPKGRSREAKLHLLELIGGWPAAFIAQKTIRHKCSKLPYQLRFWGIILLYQLAALDFIFDGLLARTVYGWVS